MDTQNEVRGKSVTMAQLLRKCCPADYPFPGDIV